MYCLTLSTHFHPYRCCRFLGCTGPTEGHGVEQPRMKGSAGVSLRSREDRWKRNTWLLCDKCGVVVMGWHECVNGTVSVFGLSRKEEKRYTSMPHFHTSDLISTSVPNVWKSNSGVNLSSLMRTTNAIFSWAILNSY